MSKICQICAKGYQKANIVPRGVGKRVTKRTTIRRMPNLRSKKININGVNVKIRLCASCLKRMKFDKAAQEKAASSL